MRSTSSSGVIGSRSVVYISYLQQSSQSVFLGFLLDYRDPLVWKDSWSLKREAYSVFIMSGVSAGTSCSVLDLTHLKWSQVTSCYFLARIRPAHAQSRFHLIGRRFYTGYRADLFETCFPHISSVTEQDVMFVLLQIMCTEWICGSSGCCRVGTLAEVMC